MRSIGLNWSIAGPVVLTVALHIVAHADEASHASPSMERSATEPGEAPAWIQDLPQQVMAFLSRLQYTPESPEEPWGLFTFSVDCPAPYSVYAPSFGLPGPIPSDCVGAIVGIHTGGASLSLAPQLRSEDPPQRMLSQ